MTAETPMTVYFAYGSNMDPDQMARRCPGSRPIGPARLAGHRLVFTRDSHLWGGGVGHVEPAEGDEVWGVLWEITAEDEDALDGYERVAQGWYRKDSVDVERDGAPVRAMIYIAVPRGGRRPSRKYVGALVRGAEHFGLPDPYVERLRGHAS